VILKIIFYFIFKKTCKVDFFVDFSRILEPIGFKTGSNSSKFLYTQLVKYCLCPIHGQIPR
jgi:hypothetical protein